MGCVFSRPFLQSRQRCFNVWNVDDHGNHLNHGKIEVTNCDLVLHQRGQGSVHWPLRSLRRYGFDAELFSFECGRRCPTGPGIYAFKCRQAETLFNVLQECIQNSSNPYNNNNGGSRVQSPSALDEPQSITVNMLTPVLPPPDSSYLEPRSSDPSVLNMTSVSPGRGSITTPTSAFSTRHYVNELQGHQYVNTSMDKYMNGLACVDLNTNYARLDELLKQERFYVNVTPDAKESLYANVVEGCSPSPFLTSDNNQTETEEQPEEEPGSPQVNYIQLDLDQQQVTQSVSQTLNQELNSVTSSPPSSPQACEGYATIDFARTAALSNSAVASIDEDQSVRKTRHNSTIA